MRYQMKSAAKFVMNTRDIFLFTPDASQHPIIGPELIPRRESRQIYSNDMNLN